MSNSAMPKLTLSKSFEMSVGQIKTTFRSRGRVIIVGVVIGLRAGRSGVRILLEERGVFSFPKSSDGSVQPPVQ
jgi:hypothetical protein